MKNEFKKDFTVLSKDPKIAEKLEENFHFFAFKTEEEKQRSLKKNFNVKVRYTKWSGWITQLNKQVITLE